MKLKKNRISSVYKRPKDRRLILNITVIVLVLVASVVITAAYGNELKKRAGSFDSSPPPQLPADTASSVSDEPNEENAISTLYLPSAAFAGKEEFSAAVEALPDSCTALSLMLYTANDGARWQASSASIISAETGTSTLTAPDMFSLLKEKGIYSSAVFESRAFAEGLAPAEKAVLASYEQLLITELYASGCNEILIYNAGVTADTVDEITEYCKTLKKLCNGITVGISLPRGADISENGSLIYSRLASSFDFLCLDLTAALYADINNTLNPLLPDVGSADGTEETEDDAIDFPTVRETVEYELLHISRYGMRVLFRISDNASVEGCSTVLLPFLADLSLHSVSLVSEQ